MSIIFEKEKDKSKQEVVNEIIYQLSFIKNQALVNKIKSYLVEPTLHMVIWDYREETKLPAWLILKSEEHGTAILYSEYGFDFGNWGLATLTDSPMHFGMDSGWFKSLEEVFLETWMAE